MSSTNKYWREKRMVLRYSNLQFTSYETAIRENVSMFCILIDNSNVPDYNTFPF